MANFKQCRYCSRIFDSQYSAQFCVECMEQLDEAFIKVRDYLYDHNNADMPSIVEATEVEEKAVLQLMKDGRITLSSGAVAGGGLKCKACGSPVSSGRFCEKCLSSLDKLQSKFSPNADWGEGTKKGPGTKPPKGRAMYIDFSDKK